MRKPVVRLFAALVLARVALSPLAAQTTGSIRGVVETSHSALPGVTVEAKSPNLQGSRIAVTDAEGRFVLTLLPPGKYTVSATLDGFAPRSETVQLALTQAASITIELTPAKTEAVTVTAEAAAVETDSTVVGRNLDAKTFEALPTGRNYSSVVQLASGVGTDNSDSRNTAITVYGSSGARELVLHRRRRTRRGVEYGCQGKTLNFEFIQEVEFKAGGYEAEYGGSTGGIINVDHQVGRQRVPRRRVRLLQQRRPAGLEQAPGRGVDQGIAGRLHQGGLRRRHRRLHPQGHASGSSARTTASTTRRRRA